jgi:hypothetical protein
MQQLEFAAEPAQQGNNPAVALQRIDVQPLYCDLSILHNPQRKRE